jgi:hypothetical protein
LKAVAAAIALDPESLSPVVDNDPTSGNMWVSTECVARYLVSF